MALCFVPCRLLIILCPFVHDTGLHHDGSPRLTTVLLECTLVYLFIYLMTRLARKFTNLLQYCDNTVTVKDKQPSFDEEHRLHQIHPPIRGE